jgi:NAD-dependent SIR2 family protein deacetylase
MPVIKIHCTSCGGDRFKASTNSLKAEQVSHIYCDQCSAPVRVSDVVWYQEDFISARALALEDNVSFADCIRLIAGT